MNVKAFENERWSTKKQSPEFRHGAAVRLVQKAPALDVGCGDGLFLSMLKKKNIKAEGIDLSEEAVARCHEQGLSAVVGDFAEALPYADDSFATVVALDVLEHLYAPEKLLQEMKRVSSANLLIAVPNFSSLPARIQTALGKVPENNRPNKGHIYWFNWHTLRRMLKSHNLVITSLAVNAPWERVPLLGAISKSLARLFPNLFALSFVVVCSPDTSFSHSQ